MSQIKVNTPTCPQCRQKATEQPKDVEVFAPQFKWVCNSCKLGILANGGLVGIRMLQNEDVPDNQIWMVSSDGSDAVKIINIDDGKTGKK